MCVWRKSAARAVALPVVGAARLAEERGGFLLRIAVRRGRGPQAEDGEAHDASMTKGDPCSDNHAVRLAAEAGDPGHHGRETSNQGRDAGHRERAHCPAGEDPGGPQPRLEVAAPGPGVGLPDATELRRAAARLRQAVSSRHSSHDDCSAMLMPSAMTGCASPAALPTGKRPRLTPQTDSRPDRPGSQPRALAPGPL